MATKHKLILARVLVEAMIGGVISVKPNDVVAGVATDIDALVKAGEVDKNPKAVTYAQSLNPEASPIKIGEASDAALAEALEDAKAAVAAAELKLTAATDEDKQAAQTELDAAKAKLNELLD